VILVDLIQIGSLVLVPIPNVPRTSADWHLSLHPFLLGLHLLLTHLSTLNLSQNITLHMSLSLSRIRILSGKLLISFNYLVFSSQFAHAMHSGLLLLLINNRFGIVGKLLPLVSHVLHLLTLNLAFLVKGSQHVSTFVVLLHPFDVLVVFLLGYGFFELVSVVLLVKCLLDLRLSLFTLVRLDSVLSNSTPLIDISFVVGRVVAFVFLVKLLDLLHFVLQRLFNAMLQL
jgi:hypothetical protein